MTFKWLFGIHFLQLELSLNFEVYVLRCNYYSILLVEAEESVHFVEISVLKVSEL